MINVFFMLSSPWVEIAFRLDHAAAGQPRWSGRALGRLKAQRASRCILFPPAELLLAEPPRPFRRIDFQSADGRLLCGTWNSDPYRRKAITYDFFELMAVVRGEMALADDAGTAVTFGPGAVFAVLHEARASFEVTPVDKIAAILRSGN
ncbi:MAG: DUF861 domain-containing protein [Proteobacteria bacterium]|nr:MAG: DUF861 domain-containing protein [Pseudomonadota bacterium]